MFIVAVNTDGKLFPLCQGSLKTSTINPEIYIHEKCFTKGSYMHCPNTNTTKSHFSQGSDMDLNITENDKICTSCYKSCLKIITHLKQNCHDYELSALLNNISHAFTKCVSRIYQL